MPTRTPRNRRPYRSELRAAQAVATRLRILDALKRSFTQGAAELSIAALAREARVSLPTVYRHFPTRRALFDAFRLHVEGPLAAQDVGRLPVHRAAVAAAIRTFFARFDTTSDPLSGPGRLAAPLAWEFSREATVPGRRIWAERLVEARAPHAAGRSRERLIDLIVVLVSSSMGEACRGYLQATGAHTGDLVTWAVDALLAHAESSAASPRRTRS